jgi:hypothetical protein
VTNQQLLVFLANVSSNQLGYSQYHIAVAWGSESNACHTSGPTRYRDVVLTVSKFGCGSAALCNLRNLWMLF